MSGQDLNQDLLAAAKKGDAVTVRTLLTQGADVNTKDFNQQTALMLAASAFGHADTVQVLLSAGADIEAQNVPGQTALVLATITGDVDMMQALLDKGADTEVKGGGMTALMQAVCSGRKTVLVLLAKGADVNAKDSNGKTVLMWAVDPQFHSHNPIPDVLQALLDKGAEVNARDNDGRTALFWLSSALTKTDFNPPALDVLLAHGADVNAKDSQGQTPLMRAAIGSLGTMHDFPAHTFVKTLIAHGADVNATDSTGQTALMLARGNAPIIALLTKAGAKN